MIFTTFTSDRYGAAKRVKDRASSHRTAIIGTVPLASQLHTGAAATDPPEQLEHAIPAYAGRIQCLMQNVYRRDIDTVHAQN
jgi:hypothetical protein